MTPWAGIVPLRINTERLCGRLEALARIGAIAGNGVSRLALTDADQAARDQVVGWMEELGLELSVDRIGNVLGLRAGAENVPPVTVGSHIDTVSTGGRFDGNLGVLAGLEVAATLNDAAIATRKPLALGFFTNEEGARFAPDMMGSGVHQGALDLQQMLAVTDCDGTSVGKELERIGYAGDVPVGRFCADSYIELHIEQGPLLEHEGYDIGAVTGVQGISWSEYILQGTSNHAGTTPMHLRRDPGYVAAAITVQARRLAQAMAPGQVATVGVTSLVPNLVNVIAREARITVDLRNTEEQQLQQAERQLAEFIEQTASAEGVRVTARRLARFEPVAFDPGMVELVEQTAGRLGFKVRRIASGAGHDAQMFAPNCPTAMIFVPSRGGISHNVDEYTSPQQIEAGANVLLQTVLQRCELASGIPCRGC